MGKPVEATDENFSCDGALRFGLSEQTFSKAIATILAWEDSTDPAVELLERLVSILAEDSA